MGLVGDIVLAMDGLMSVVGNHSCVCVVDWSSMGLVLELNMGLLLSILVIGVWVLVVWHFVVDGSVMNNAWLIMTVGVVSLKTLSVVKWRLMSVFAVNILVTEVSMGIAMGVAAVVVTMVVTIVLLFVL